MVMIKIARVPSSEWQLRATTSQHKKRPSGDKMSLSAAERRPGPERTESRKENTLPV